MRLGRWLIVGKDALDMYAQAGQGRKASAKLSTAVEELRRLRGAHERERRHHREALDEKEQLKGILGIVAPERLAEWRAGRKAEREAAEPRP